MNGLIATLIVGLSEASKLKAVDSTKTITNFNGDDFDPTDFSNITNVNVFNFFGPIYGDIFTVDDDVPDDDGELSQYSNESSSNQDTGGYDGN